MTDTERAALERRIDELCAEVEAAKHDLSIFSGRIVELNAENAKLRQLALELFLTLDGIAIDKDGWACYAAQLHELGLEA